MIKKTFSKLGAYVGALPVLLLPLSVSAAGLADNAGNFTALKTGGATSSTADLPTLIGRLIGVLLGVLGIILVVYIIQAGIMYMTAAGDPAKVDKAKKMITQAVVGIIIIVAAYSISDFVIKQILTTQV